MAGLLVTATELMSQSGQAATDRLVDGKDIQQLQTLKSDILRKIANINEEIAKTETEERALQNKPRFGTFSFEQDRIYESNSLHDHKTRLYAKRYELSEQIKVIDQRIAGGEVVTKQLKAAAAQKLLPPGPSPRDRAAWEAAGEDLYHTAARNEAGAAEAGSLARFYENAARKMRALEAAAGQAAKTIRTQAAQFVEPKWLRLQQAVADEAAMVERAARLGLTSEPVIKAGAVAAEVAKVVK